MGKLLDENSVWVKENYPEFSKALDAAEAKDRAKEEAKAKKAGYPSAEAEEKALRQKAIEDLTNKKGTSLNREAARGGASSGGGGGVPKIGAKRTPEFKKGGKVSSASKRADGCAIRGKTRA